MDRLSSAGMLVARILLSGIFLVSGVKKVFAFSATQGYMAQYGMKMTGLFLVLAILLEVGGAHHAVRAVVVVGGDRGRGQGAAKAGRVAAGCGDGCRGVRRYRG